MRNKFLLLAVSIFFVLSGTVFAHQPRITDGNNVIVSYPEISQAFYSQLDGDNHTYTISSDDPFLLYINLVVPDIPNQKTDISAIIIKDGNYENPISTLDGKNYEWQEFFEHFGYDAYLTGPEYKEEVEAGDYQIFVSSKNNDSKYSIAIGSIETFDFKESMNALKLIPQIKREFFEKSPIDFIFSPFGWGLILVMFILAFVFGFIYRLILKRLSKNKIRKRHKNIGWKDRVFRLVLAIVLFVIAITTSWSPILLFFSGFTLFEAIFSWCGFYAAIGKSSCPL